MSISHLSEKVLCVERSYLESVIPPFQGYFGTISEIANLFSPKESIHVLSRSEVENDPSYKQLITYSVVQAGSRYDRIFFSYSRGGTEKRLDSRLSLGVGGHVGPIPSDMKYYPNIKYAPIFNWLSIEAQREIQEEISYDRLFNVNKRFGLSILGLINDDSDHVGKVHLGILYDFHISDPYAKSREPALRDGSMISPRQILSNYDRYESWSKIYIDNFIKK
jgi:predicted NUDIX family phosphoesterase